MIIDSGRYTMESSRQFSGSFSQQMSMERGIMTSNGTRGAKEMQESKGAKVTEGTQETQELQGVKATEETEETQGTGNFYESLLEKIGDYSESLSNNNRNVSGSLAARQRKLAQSMSDRTKELGQGLTTVESMNNQAKFETLSYLFRIFFGNNPFFRNTIWGSGFSQGMRYQSYSITQSYEETETTTFDTSGTVKTADGREINFNINVEMSRSFYEETNMSFMKETNPLIDPLVINLNGNPDSISDQTFYFDLNADGEEEEISNLVSGCSFLAFDKNEDGEINDGSELFGALTGDGFEELAEYDLDGNGWIDEADDIFDKLKVWSVDDKGKAVMYTLKESDVGAICLSAIPTKFSVKDENNDMRAMVQKSGFFLRESDGSAGAVQQIDLAAS